MGGRLLLVPDKFQREVIVTNVDKTIIAYYAYGAARHPRSQANKLFPSRDFR